MVESVGTLMKIIIQTKEIVALPPNKKSQNFLKDLKRSAKRSGTQKRSV